MKVYVYPANSCICGPIEERIVYHFLERKVLYDKEDQYGYIGSKKSCIFFTESQAEMARDVDIKREENETSRSNI